MTVEGCVFALAGREIFTPGHCNGRMRAALILLTVLTGAPSLAQPLTTGSSCGGDAFSSARVIEHRPPRRGPLTAVPDTLCADVAPQHPEADVQIEVFPGIVPQVGRGGRAGPYGGY